MNDLPHRNYHISSIFFKKICPREMKKLQRLDRGCRKTTEQISKNTQEQLS